MLTSLSIKNFTLVDQLDIEFTPGMTAITGETGAGKSLILGALGMALGDRGDTDRIRTGSERCEVTASFTVTGNPLASQWLVDSDLAEGDECLLRRTLTAEGRSRGFINGQPATMHQLQQLGELIIDIHSQYEHQSLLKRDTHRRLLDVFSGAEELAGEVASLYQAWRQARQRFEDRESRAEELAARGDLLRFQLDELEALALADGELEALEKEQYLQANAEQILRDSATALALCKDSEEGDILSLLAQAHQLLNAIPDKPPSLAEAQSLLDSARIQVDEAAHELRHYMEGFELDPERQRGVEERLSLAYQIARKHRIQPPELVALQRRLADELAQVSDDSGGLDTLRQHADHLERQLGEAERQLSMKRQAAAEHFADAVNEQLASLAMSGASLSVSLAARSDHSPYGREIVEFLLSTNTGQPHRSLNRIASGGELSRISLAIQVVAARHTRIPTLVFDEVDVGIGGAVAEVVGKLLRELGDKGQVICVTHLPQVASCAHHHLLASKEDNGEKVTSGLDSLDARDRVGEIARMLGGATITAQTLSHAQEMLELSGQKVRDKHK